RDQTFQGGNGVAVVPLFHGKAAQPVVEHGVVGVILLDGAKPGIGAGLAVLFETCEQGMLETVAIPFGQGWPTGQQGRQCQTAQYPDRQCPERWHGAIPFGLSAWERRQIGFHQWGSGSGSRGAIILVWVKRESSEIRCRCATRRPPAMPISRTS